MGIAIFTDSITSEKFSCECYAYQYHNLQNYNEEFAKWYPNRILRAEFNFND